MSEGHQHAQDRLQPVRLLRGRLGQGRAEKLLSSPEVFVEPESKFLLISQDSRIRHYVQCLCSPWRQSASLPLRAITGLFAVAGETLDSAPGTGLSRLYDVLCRFALIDIDLLCSAGLSAQKGCTLHECRPEVSAGLSTTFHITDDRQSVPLKMCSLWRGGRLLEPVSAFISGKRPSPG